MAESEVDAVAEALKSVSITNAKEDGEKTRHQKPGSNHCCICQEQCVNPVELPCSHVFCFLCIKGAAARNNHCALCRQRINPDVLSNPSVINRNEIATTIQRSGESYRWYYEARNGGWWLYEQRTSTEIEKGFKADKQRPLRLQISGFYYIVDFEKMLQYREEFPNRRRQIKRDKVSADTVKGVAGIVVQEINSPQESASDRKQLHDEGDTDGGNSHTNPAESNSDPFTEASGLSETQTRLVTGLD
jgi:E3 ubiquitin-protein ligase RNF146